MKRIKHMECILTRKIQYILNETLERNFCFWDGAFIYSQLLHFT